MMHSWDLLADNLYLDIFKHLHTADLMTAAKSVFHPVCLICSWHVYRPTLVFRLHDRPSSEEEES